MQVRLDKFIIDVIAELHHCHSQLRAHVVNSLDEGRSHIKSIIDEIGGQVTATYQRDEKLDEFECGDVHIRNDANTNLVSQVCQLMVSAVNLQVVYLSLCVCILSILCHFSFYLLHCPYKKIYLFCQPLCNVFVCGCMHIQLSLK